MNNIIPLTLNGLKILKKKLFILKNKIRPKIIKDISIAREYGDLKENSEYQTAKQEQFLNEKKIKNIEYTLNNSSIININTNNDIVKFGNKITLLNLITNKKIKYTIVGKDEANYKKFKISYNSPLAKGLLGKKLNEQVKINIPLGIIKYKILKIS